VFEKIEQTMTIDFYFLSKKKEGEFVNCPHSVSVI